jgi:hypothetical protein
MSKKSRSKVAPNPGWYPKGRSGNLNGRPRASSASQASTFDIVVDKTLTVTHHGVTREMTIEEGLQQKTYQNALAGNRMAMREVAKWIRKRDAWFAKRASRASSRPAIKSFRSPDPDNADTALLVLGIAAPNPARAGLDTDLLLEPWATQAALRRRRGGKRLTDWERAEIRRCTRDPDCLRWPRETIE